MAVRPAGQADLPAVARVSAATGQSGPGTGEDPLYMSLLLDEGHVVVGQDAQERVLGWGATIPTPLGVLLSDLFVDPGRHGRGLGRALLQALYPDPSAPGRFTFSSQHPSALPLYARAGLRARWPLLYVSGDGARLAAGRLVAERVSPGDAADAEAGLTPTSHPRAGPYRLWSGDDGFGLLVRDGEAIVAAGAVRRGVVEHVTCPSAALATEALRAAVVAAGPGRSRSACPAPTPPHLSFSAPALHCAITTSRWQPRTWRCRPRGFTPPASASGPAGRWLRSRDLWARLNGAPVVRGSLHTRGPNRPGARRCQESDIRALGPCDPDSGALGSRDPTHSCRRRGSGQRNGRCLCTVRP